MDLKIFLTFAILSLALVSAHRRQRRKHSLGQRRNPGFRRNPNFSSRFKGQSSRFQGQNRRSRFRKAKRNDLAKLLPYEAEENVKVRERMDVSLWQINGQGQTTNHRRPKRDSSGHINVKRVPSEKLLDMSSTLRDRESWIDHNNAFGVGTPWPLPQHYDTDPSTVYRLDPGLFYMAIGILSQSCDTLTGALRRYFTTITGNEASGQSVVTRTNREYYPSVTGNPPTLNHIEVYVLDSCSDGYPGPSSNESYSLHITNSSAYLKSAEVWGILRGLETFSQIVYRRQSDSRQLYVNWTVISDYPRFPHRGVLVDTGRHYLHPNTFRKTLEAMEQNKLNVLHWHLTDDQSFPLVTRTYPQLSGKGSFGDGMTYREADIADVVEFARQRGIRIMPELDTPGHTRSWRRGLPDITMDCDDVDHRDVSGVLDVSNNHTYTVVSQLWSELLSLFPDQSIHLGGDEVSATCWSQSNQIDNFMKNEEIRDYKQLIAYYTKRLTKIVQDLDRKKQLILWDDVLDNFPQIDKNVIIQIWRPKPRPVMQSSAESGHRMVYSSPWYLNNVTYGREWMKFYLADPLQHLADPSQLQLVVGGEACIWGEYVDNSNLLKSMWPRASAVAERLWSAPYVRNVTEAKVRLEEQRCRMIRRGIPVSPVNGPSSCNLHVP